MSTPEIEQVAAWTAVLGTTPVVIVLPRFRGVAVDPESGARVTADAWAAALTAHGAQPIRDTDFAGDPVPGWQVTIGRGVTGVRITGPAGLGEIYDGGLRADTKWRERVAGLHHIGRGLVVVSGTADHLTPDAALELVESERAVWVRARTELA